VIRAFVLNSRASRFRLIDRGAVRMMGVCGCLARSSFTRINASIPSENGSVMIAMGAKRFRYVDCGAGGKVRQDLITGADQGVAQVV